jgi:hypothetical protein
MKFLVLALACLSTPAIAAPYLMEVMAPRSGNYSLTWNDPANPCRFATSDVDALTVVRLNVYMPTETNEFFTKGDVVVKLDRWHDSSSPGWATLFDRAPFFMINRGTQRSVVKEMGVLVSHQSLYDFAKNRLQHSVTTTSFSGGEQSVQVIQFEDALRKFTYTYEYSTRNALGFTKETFKAGHCEFTKL